MCIFSACTQEKKKVEMKVKQKETKKRKERNTRDNFEKVAYVRSEGIAK